MSRLLSLPLLLLCLVLVVGDVSAAPLPFVAVGPVDPRVAAAAALRRPRVRRLRRPRVSSASSVSSSIASMEQSSSSPALTASPAGTSSQSSAMETQRVYAAFLNRYLTIPADWAVTVDEDKHLFTAEKANAEPGKDKHKFTITLININDCDVGAIQENFRKRNVDKTPVPPVPAVNYVRIAGILASSYKWKDDTTPGGILQYCVLPPRLIRASHIRTSETDAVSIKLIEGTLLRQVALEERSRSR